MSSSSSSSSSLFLTAACDTLVALVHSQSVGHLRLSIPLYNLEGVLQSTLTCSLNNNNEDIVVKKLLFCTPQYQCALLNNHTVVVWSVTRGVVVHTLELQEGGAYDMASLNKSETLYVLTSKKSKLYVHEYSLETGKVVRKIKCGMHSSNGLASLAVSTEFIAIRQDDKVRVLSMEHGSKVAKLKVSGSMLMSMSGARLAIVTSTGITLYKVDDASPENSVGQIFTEQPVDSMEITEDVILANTESASMLYKWPSSFTKEPLTPVTNITSKDVETARLQFASSKTLVAVLHSSTKGIHVQRVSYMNDDKNVLDHMVVGFPSEENKEEKDDAKATNKRNTPSSTTTTLGPGQAGGEALQASDRPTKKSKPNIEEDVSIAERLKQLAQEMERDNEKDEDDDDESPKPFHSFNTKKATTESLSNLLSQALSSGDDSMLELSLGVRDKRVIATSLQELNADFVSLLLTKLTFRLSNKPNRAAELSLWISLVLTSGKIGQTQQLRPLRNLLQERVDSFPHLLQLEGRLSILAAMK